MPLSDRAPTSDRRPWACQRVVVPCARYWASSSRGVLYPRGCRMRVAARGQLVPRSRHVGSRRPPNRGARADTNTNCGSGDQGMWPQRSMLPRQGHFPRRSSLGWSQATDTACTAASRSEPSTAARTLFVAAAQTHDRPSHRRHVIDIIKSPTSGQNRRTPDHRLRRKADTNDQRVLHNAE